VLVYFFVWNLLVTCQVVVLSVYGQKLLRKSFFLQISFILYLCFEHYSISCIDIIVCHVRSVTSVSVHLSIVVRLFVRFIGNCIVSVCVRCCD